jgi:FkbM family methyltransferase
VLDLGGCIGAFGDVVIRAGAAVVALEPEPENAILYRENVPEALVLTAAASDREGIDSLWLGSTNSHALGKRRGRDREVLVQTMTLPELIRVFSPDIVKCDIEGAEYLLDWTGLDCVREIALEFHFTPKRHWRQEAYRVVATIEKQGFEQVRPFKDTGKNWNCVTGWRR